MLAVLVQPAAAGQFRAPDITVNEGEVAVFRITLPRTYSFDVRFAYRTMDGSARKGRYYIAKQGHVVFPAGTRSARVEVQTRLNPDRTKRDFKLALSDKEMFRESENAWRA
ncbi:MAG: hypothetical protein F4X91_05680 [Nitrospinae bacterium]|nr:hypothetical protein [Nitrospinota bacterium]